MDSRGAGYWVCRSCGHHNLRQLSMCVSCDEPASGASPSRVTSTPARPTSASPASRPFETSSISRGSPERSRFDGAASARGYESPAPPRYTPGSTGGAGGSSPQRSTYHAQAFVQDLDNKNAVIARLERHVSTMVEQQGRMKKAHETEIAGIESQMHQAVDAHRMLMHEYRQCASDVTNAKAELSVAHSEIASLQERLQSEAKRRVEQSEAHLAEMEQKQKEVRAAKEAAATAQDKLDAANDDVARLRQGRAVSGTDSFSSATPRREAAASLQLTEMLARNDELAATVERLRLDLDASRSSLDDARQRYTDDLKRVMREATEANEKAVSGVATELTKVREAAEHAANRDRQYVEHQLKDASDLTTRLQGQLEREGARNAERIKELEDTVKHLRDQRDTLMEESRFSSEIQQDYVKEQTQLKAEVSSLRAALRDAEARRSGVAPSPLSAANSSHGASNAAKQPPPVNMDDVDAMNNSVRDAMGGRSGSAGTADDAAARLVAAEESLSQKDVTIATLRGQLETQRAAFEVDKERLAEALEDNAALKEAFDIMNQSQPRADSPPAAAAPALPAPSTTEATSASASAEEVAAVKEELARLKEEYENLDSKYMFDTGELRKQVGNLQKKVRDREGDIEELTEETEQLNEALAALREASLNQPAAAVAPAPASAGGGGDTTVLEATIADLKESLERATAARDDKDDLLEIKDKEFETQRQQLMETITRLTDDLKAASADIAELREELDAANRALEDSEAVCRDALQSLRHEL